MEVVRVQVKCAYCQRNTSVGYKTFTMEDGSNIHLHKVCYAKFLTQRLRTVAESLLPRSGLTHAVILKDIRAAMEREDLGLKPRLVATRSLKSMFTIQCGTLQQQILDFTADLFLEHGCYGERTARTGEEEFIDKVDKKCYDLLVHIAKQMYI